MKKRKYLIGGLICFLLIGFAAIATTLILNGNVNIGFNESDFGIYFSKSILDLTDVSKETISSDGQTIDFNATLTEVNKATELDYEVTNSSKNYDAKVSIECSFQNEGSSINFDELVSMEYLNNEDIIPARSKGTGHVSLKLKKAITEDITTKLKCNLNFEPVEREELGETSDDINNNSLSGYLIDENRKLLPNKNLVVLKDENAYITTNEEAFLTIGGLDVDIYDIYIIENKTIEEIKNMTNDQIKDIALTKAKFTHSSKEITFDNGYKIVNELDKHTVNFDPNGGSVSSAKKEVVYKKPYGELPKPTRDNYVFIGWYTDRDAGDEITSTTKVETNEDHTLYAHWEISDLLVDVVSNLAKTDTTNLSYDETNENNIRYIGTNPSNYVSFNGELWRIIGVMNDVEDSTGTVARHAKIIKEEKIPSMSYDNTATLSRSGINDWSKSSLQEVLNSGAYWNRTSGTCPAGSNGYTSTCDYTGTGLKNDAKKMISNVVWKLGAIQGTTTTTRDFYNDERGTKVPDNHATRWIGKVGLMYPSDYGYAVGGDVREEALLTSLTNYETEDGVSFADYNWLKYDSSEWTITPSLTGTFLTFYKSANLATASATSNYFVRPSLHLGSYIKVVDGDGTRENPYILAINNNVRYKVNFDSNGGTKVDTVLTVRNGEKYGTLPTVERDNLVFEGWYTEKTGGTKVTSTTTVDIGDNQTLYAHWTIRGVLKDGISELSKTDTTNLSHDNTSENNLRYIGTNPNNYVSFNGELWRIIGVMNDIEDSTGTKGEHVKLIRNNFITNSHTYDTTGYYGSNDWSTSALNNMLNNGPYWNRTSGMCPAGSNGYTTSCDFSDIGLKADAKKMISNVTWKLGGVNSASVPANLLYQWERASNTPDNHAAEWTGKVGLMYPSDYGYAVENAKEISSNYSVSNYGAFTNVNWLYNNNSEWTITPSLSNNYQSVYVSGGTYTQNTSYISNVRPSVYLGSYIKVVDGDGTKENPYKLAINNDVSYVVGFDSNGGEKVNTVLSVKNGQPYGELPTIERNNFAFEGWYTEKDGGTQVTSETIVDLADNQILYAHWALRGILKDGIQELAKTDKTTLSSDGTNENNIRYIGTNPNNYVKFNDETWRILGVMKNVEDSTGTKADHVKIIRDETIGNYSFDNKSEGYGSSTDYNGSSNWSDARLMTTLNDGPYWYREKGTCYKGQSDGTVKCDFTNNGLTDNAKQMISKVVWNLGGRSDYNANAQTFYQDERSDNTIDNHDTKWTGNVGLMYPSDFVYGIGGNSRDTCLSKNLGSWDSSCYPYNWLYATDKNGYTIDQLTITPQTNYKYNVFTGRYGINYTGISYTDAEVLPSVYLTSNIRVVGGHGTKESPYELSINDNTSETHLISFDANGGNNIETTLNATYGEKYGTLPNATRPHFIFAGWYTDKENGTKIEEDSIFNYTDNQTLYAHWIANGTPVDVIKEIEKYEKRNLAYDGTVDNNLRYVGKDPKNYIWFNDEMWRIIGVMNNIKDEHGNKSSYVKIMRDDFIGEFKWYYDGEAENGLSDNSDYTQSHLMPLLNSGAYWNRTTGTYFDGYDTTNKVNLTKPVDYTDTGLTERARLMTTTVEWNLGGGTSTSASPNSFYTSERGENPVEGYASTWAGNVGLIYVSDYGYAAIGPNRNACAETSLGSFYNCSKYNWITRSDGFQWTISSYSHTSGGKLYGGSIFNIGKEGSYLNESWSSYATNVRPVIYLNSNVKMQGGSGSKEKPFRLKLINDAITGTHTVTFDSTGGSTVPTVLTVTKEEKYGKLPITEKDNYSFTGWYTEEIGGEKVTKDTIVKLENDQTLYAHWVPIIADQGNMITSLEKLAEKNNVDLLYDGTIDNNLRYVGSSPNNYVEFNDELWQIIGVMNNVTDTDGNKKSLVKLISASSPTNRAHFTPEVDGDSTLNSLNDWSKSTLKDWFNHQLTGEAISLAKEVVWPLGGSQTKTTSVPNFYSLERGTTVYGGNAKTWNGYVGLMYPSDFGFAVGGDTRDICIVDNLDNYESNSCGVNSWLNGHGITLTQESTTKVNLYNVQNYKLDTTFAWGTPTSYPVVYLNENVEIVEGSGSQENPYKIKLANLLGDNASTHTVSFNANGGNDVETILTVTNGEKYGSLPTSTKDNYSFAGWYTEKDGGSKVTSTSIVDLTINQTLYAHWVSSLAQTGNIITSLTSLAEENNVELSYDGTIDNNLRYIGSNPANYVQFNGELWRIIGTMNNIEDKNSNKSSYVKLIRDESKTETWNNNSSNDWTTSALQTTLNSGDYYNRTGNYSSNGLTDDAKAMISEVVWQLGGNKREVTTASAYYNYERETYVYSSRPVNWVGKVGLIYPSDYGFAVGGEVKNDCLNLNMQSYNRNSCYSNDWLYLNNYDGQWTLTPNHTSYYVNYISEYGYIGFGQISNWYSKRIRPVVYLNPSINITGGSGTEDDPYTIALSE